MADSLDNVMTKALSLGATAIAKALGIGRASVYRVLEAVERTKVVADLHGTGAEPIPGLLARLK
jgi:DNA-binding IclR family transcriptional regulator